MAPPRNPNYVYKDGDVRRQRPFEMKICPQCCEKKLIPVRNTFCSKSCSVSANHRQGLYKPLRGPDSPAWKGDEVSYQNQHTRIYRLRGKASHCANREQKGCTGQRFEWAHVHGTDPGDPTNYTSLCISCHRSYDVSRGADNPLAKLTDEQVAAIKSLYVPRVYSQARLASEFGVSQTVISTVIRGKRYAPAGR